MEEQEVAVGKVVNVLAVVMHVVVAALLKGKVVVVVAHEQW